MSQISRTYTFSDAVEFHASQLESELFNIVNTWNNTDRGILKWNFASFAVGGVAQFISNNGALTSIIKYIINNFVIQGDATNGLNLYGGGANISLGETSGSYGGGVKVVFIPDRSAAPTSAPTGGLVIYSENGSLKYEDSSGNFIKLNGEVVSSVVGNSNAGTSTQWADITSISLTPGNWMIYGVVNCELNGATATVTQLGISTTTGNSATGLVFGDNYINILVPTGVQTNNGSLNWNTQLNSNATVYLKHNWTFSAGTPRTTGSKLIAVRLR